MQRHKRIQSADTFLDIELPGDNGVYAGKYIRETLNNDRMNIVFISHKTSYAMELFKFIHMISL